MTEQDSYQKLLEATKGGCGKIDPQIIHTLADWAELGYGVDALSVPMIAMIRGNGFWKIAECATI